MPKTLFSFINRMRSRNCAGRWSIRTMAVKRPVARESQRFPRCSSAACSSPSRKAPRAFTGSPNPRLTASAFKRSASGDRRPRAAGASQPRCTILSTPTQRPGSARATPTCAGRARRAAAPRSSRGTGSINRQPTAGFKFWYAP